jgi:hypothetical protein
MNLSPSKPAVLSPTAVLSPKPILVCGAHRTGTTWVGKALAAAPQVAYISEPLNVLHRPGVLRVPVRYWYTYICAENEADFLPGLRETLQFRYHFARELLSLRSSAAVDLPKDIGRMGRDAGIFLRGRLAGQTPLLKDPFAVFSALWFARRLGCQVVITIRHPAAFASSLVRLNWPFDFSDLLAQPLLMRDWLEPFRAEMEELAGKVSAQDQRQTQNQAHSGTDPAEILVQGSLLWRMVYQAVDRMLHTSPEPHPGNPAAGNSPSLQGGGDGVGSELIVVRHEDLSLDPVGGFRALYQRLGLEFTPQVEKTIYESSSSENPKELSKKNVHSVRLDSQANLHNWKRRLSREQIDSIRKLTEETATLFYPEMDW